MRLYPLPTGAFINLLEISEITPLPGAVSEESNAIHAPRCVVRLRNGSVHLMETESFDDAKALAAEIAKEASRQESHAASNGYRPRTNLSLRDEP